LYDKINANQSLYAVQFLGSAENMTAAENTERELLRFFGRHLVALHVEYVQSNAEKGSNSRKSAVFSGTLMYFRDVLCLLTAGHVLENIERALASDVAVESMQLLDMFGENITCSLPIPFFLDPSKCLKFHNDEDGLDFGVIILGTYYERLLAANNVVAIEEKNWEHQHELKFDGYAILGLPEEGNHSSETALSLMPTLLFLDPTAVEVEDKRITKSPRFVGKVRSLGSLSSLVGMSGGPIIGFSLKPPERFWLVAIQSSWNKQDGLVYGTKIPMLAKLLEELVSDALDTNAVA